MSAIIGIILGLIGIFGPIYAVCYFAEKKNPNATVGDVGPAIIGIILIEMILLLAFIAG